MNKEQSQQMFGVDDISVWLNDICCSNTFAKKGKAETVISLLSDVQELSFGNNGDMIRTSINRIKYLLSLEPEEELERRIVGKLMRYLESKGFEVVGVIDEEEHYTTNDLPTVMGHIFAVDEASLRVRKPDSREHGVLLIPGNEEDIIADWSYSDDDNDADGFNAVMQAFTLPGE